MIEIVIFIIGMEYPYCRYAVLYIIIIRLSYYVCVQFFYLLMMINYAFGVDIKTVLLLNDDQFLDFGCIMN